MPTIFGGGKGVWGVSKRKNRPPSRRDADLGEQRTEALAEALNDAPTKRRKALLRGVDRQPVIVREPKARPPGQQLTLLDEA